MIALKVYSTLLNHRIKLGNAVECYVKICYAMLCVINVLISLFDHEMCIGWLIVLIGAVRDLILVSVSMSISRHLLKYLHPHFHPHFHFCFYFYFFSTLTNLINFYFSTQISRISESIISNRPRRNVPHSKQRRRIYGSFIQMGCSDVLLTIFRKVRIFTSTSTWTSIWFLHKLQIYYMMMIMTHDLIAVLMFWLNKPY